MLINYSCNYYPNEIKYIASYNNQAMKEYIEIFYYKKHNVVFCRSVKTS